ncbi:MAG: ABC transporter substrate-binding protein [Spirochaetales bacterium]|nr:ABC transporter substrate-binding protein [Spirochaetales bacterium]
MFEEFEKATGIHVNFMRFSSGEALARVIAEKDNPQVDVLFGGPVETFGAGAREGVFEAYKPPAYDQLEDRFKDADGYWTAIADDPLCFMSNREWLEASNIEAPTSWDDILGPEYEDMIQFADARTSGTAVTRIFSILEVNDRDEDAAFDYMRRLKPNVQLYTKSGGGGTIPVGLGQAGMGIFFIVDALKTQQAGYDVVISFPEEGIATAAEGIAILKGAEHPGLARQLIDWATTDQMQKFYEEYAINFIPTDPGVEIQQTLADALAGANIFPIDAEYSGANRQRIVEKWISDVLQE